MGCVPTPATDAATLEDASDASSDVFVPCEPEPAPLETLPLRTTPSTYTLADYTSECVTALGAIPSFDCYSGTEVPITVTRGVTRDPDGNATNTGTTTAVTDMSQLENGTQCDRPFMIGLADNNAGPGRSTSCIPHNRLGVRHSRDSRGNVTDFVFICRAYYFRTPDAQGRLRFDDLGFIGHNPVTGATCFWAVPINANPPGMHITTDRTFAGETIPAPGSAEDQGFWKTPQSMARSRCMQCHSNDPFIHAPVVDALGILPTHPTGRYFAVAGDRLNAIEERAGSPREWNTTRHMVADAVRPCTACHRVSEGFMCDTLAGAATGSYHTPSTGSVYSTIYPYLLWMNAFDSNVLRMTYPTHATWNVAFEEAATAVRDCCNTPDGCAWRDVTTASCCTLPDGSHRSLLPDDCAGRDGEVAVDATLCARPACH